MLLVVGSTSGFLSEGFVLRGELGKKLVRDVCFELSSAGGSDFFCFLRFLTSRRMSVIICEASSLDASAKGMRVISSCLS
jgi:hypothetical protein